MEASGFLILGLQPGGIHWLSSFLEGEGTAIGPSFTMWGIWLPLFYYYLRISYMYTIYFDDIHIPLLLPSELPNTSTSQFHVPF